MLYGTTGGWIKGGQFAFLVFLRKRVAKVKLPKPKAHVLIIE